MSPHIPASLRQRVWSDARGRCAYCRSSEALLGSTFEIDHIIPVAADGETSYDNLCLSCPSCNRAKARRLSALDPFTEQSVPLFHPRQHAWRDHFAWSNDGATVVGLTATGRATIVALRMNRPVIVQMRHYWVTLGLHPPVSL